MAMRYEGWEVYTATSGTEAVRVAREVQPDALVLDMMLPDFDGLEVMRRIRTEQADVPVIFLTAKDGVADRIAGLTAGGDDYVTKPFSLEEVIARLRGLLRRSGATTARPDTQIVVGDLILDEDSHEVTRPPSSSSCATSCATPSACCRRPRSSTASGTTTSAARPTSSSCTSPTCARRSTPTASP
jgi:DNA-binding response OmpR family regulator